MKTPTTCFQNFTTLIINTTKITLSRITSNSLVNPKPPTRMTPAAPPQPLTQSLTTALLSLVVGAAAAVLAVAMELPLKSFVDPEVVLLAPKISLNRPLSLLANPSLP